MLKSEIETETQRLDNKESKILHINFVWIEIPTNWYISHRASKIQRDKCNDEHRMRLNSKRIIKVCVYYNVCTSLS